MKDSYFICIDAGTTRFKTAVINQKGDILAKDDYIYKTGKGLLHEYKKNDFINALSKTLSKTCTIIDKKSVTAIGITGHGPTLIPIDKKGNPLFTAIGYLDDRVKKYVKTLSEKESDRITSTMYIPIAMFFKEEHPEIYDKTYKFLQSFDYISYILTKNFTASSSSSGIKPWENRSIEKAGLDKEKFPSICYMGEIIGKTTKKVEAQFCIKEGIPVFAVGVDFAAALIGTNTLEKGKSCERAGSSGGINFCWDKKIEDSRLLCYKHFIKGLWNIAGITSTQGKALEWIKELMKIDNFNEVEKINKPNKIIFLPYLKGERTPLWNPYAKGIFFGLKNNHTKYDILFSVFLGIALSIRDCIEIFEENNTIFDCPILSTGGQTKNEWLMQLKSDVTGKRFATLQTQDAELIGVASILASHTGFYKDIVEASKNTVKIKKIFYPDKNKFIYYSELFDIYKDLRNKLSKYF